MNHFSCPHPPAWGPSVSAGVPAVVVVSDRRSAGLPFRLAAPSPELPSVSLAASEVPYFGPQNLAVGLSCGRTPPSGTLAPVVQSGPLAPSSSSSSSHSLGFFCWWYTWVGDARQHTPPPCDVVHPWKTFPSSSVCVPDSWCVSVLRLCVCLRSVVQATPHPPSPRHVWIIRDAPRKCFSC